MTKFRSALLAVSLWKMVNEYLVGRLCTISIIKKLKICNVTFEDSNTIGETTRGTRRQE